MAGYAPPRPATPHNATPRRSKATGRGPGNVKTVMGVGSRLHGRAIKREEEGRGGAGPGMCAGPSCTPPLSVASRRVARYHATSWCQRSDKVHCQAAASRPSSMPASRPASRPASQPVGQPAGWSTCRPACRSASRPASQPLGHSLDQPLDQPLSQPVVDQPLGHPLDQPRDDALACSSTLTLSWPRLFTGQGIVCGQAGQHSGYAGRLVDEVP